VIERVVGVAGERSNLHLPCGEIDLAGVVQTLTLALYRSDA
jgi:hypothetical protein